MIIFVILLLPAGKLEKSAVLKAVCSGFKETTEPAVCLSEGESPYFLWFSSYLPQFRVLSINFIQILRQMNV